MKILKTLGLLAIIIPWIIWQTIRGKFDITKYEVWK